MARKLVSGTIPAIGATFGTSTAISAATNAASCVFTFASGHGITIGDYFEVTALGWPLGANRVFRASAVSTNDITALNFNTSDLAKYPAGAGVGFGRRIITWAAIQQANKDQVTTTGGDQNFEQGQYIDTDLQHEYPTNKNPIRVTFVVDDDQSMTYWTTVRAAEDALTSYPIRLAYPGGSGFAVGTGVWTVSAAPDVSGFVQKRTITVAMQNKFTEYTS